MKQKLLSFILLLSVGITSAYAYDFSKVAPSGQTLYYNITSSGSSPKVSVTGPNSSSYNSWYGYTKPTGNLTIPATVTYGGTTYSVTRIEAYAFSGCSGLTSVTIQNSVTSIGSSAFNDCSGLTSVTIPNSVTSIGGSAFRGCSGLTSVTIPNSVTSIGSSAFYDCSGLTSVTIPNSVTSIGGSAFNGCSGLTTSVYNSSLFAFLPRTYSGNYSIPTGITTICGDAFAGCSGLTSLTIPNSVTLIGEFAFYNCTSLTSLTIPNSVTSIWEGTFYGCSGLTSLTIPNSVTSIGSSAFYDCSGLTSLTIPNSVTSIGDFAFSRCSGLTSIVVSSGNTVYDSRNNCEAIIETATNTLIAGCQNTTIPNSVTTIGSSAFRGCSGLTSVTIPNSVTLIGGSAFNGCSGLTSLTIPNSVTSIGYGTFEDCSSLTSVTIPNSVTEIGSESFWGCIGLTSITIPNSVISIGYSAFYRVKMIYYQGGATGAPWGALCMNGYVEDSLYYISSAKDKLTGAHPAIVSATIPNSVTSIGYGAFLGCSGLTSLTIGNSVTMIKDSAFSGCSSLTSVTIPNSVTWIGHAAFEVCSGLTSLTIGNSVTSIGNYAFDGCSGLTSLTIGNSVTEIGNYAFDGCSGLTSLTIPNSVTWIGNSAFSNCSGLTSLTIGNSVTSIGSSAFRGCSGLTSVTIPNSVTSIGGGTFEGCSGLTSVTIGNSVTSIGEVAFSHCSGLTSLTIPNSVTSIESGAFRGCSGLTSITAKSAVAPSLRSNPFYNVPSTIPVYIPCGSYASYSSTWGYFSNFIEMPFSVSVFSADSDMGSATVITNPTCTSSNATITATPNAGYTFTNWTENDSVVSTDATYTFSVTVDRTLTAHFAPAVICGIAATDLPYTDNFDTYTTSTTAKTGVQPDCWTLAKQYVTMTDEYKPMIYYNAASAHSGRYSLLINKRGIYAMPAFEGDVKDLQLQFYLRQTQTIYQLQVGVMTDLTDASTFVPVATLNNSTTSEVSLQTVDFATYTGDGHYIAFKNILEPGKSGAFSCNYIDDLVLDIRPSTCGITVDDLPYTDNFDSYTTSTTAKTGVAPECWTLAKQYVAMTDEYKPMIYYNAASAHSGRYSLLINKRGIYAMPAFEGDVKDLQLQFYLRQTQTIYQLQVGVMTDLTDASTFVPVATLNNSTTSEVSLQTVDFATYTGDGHYIAFKNILEPGKSGAFSCNYIDDLVLDLRPVNTCTGITVDDLPYIDNFDSYTASTTAKTGVAPDCWTLAYQEVAMTDEYKPMIYYNSSNAHSGSYSLILNKRCLYAMPAYDGNVSTLQLSFYLKQTNANYGLTVGVMSDLGDPSTFVPVASFNNPSTTNHEYVVVDFSSYTGDGHYIAFRNTNTAFSNFSCNYIDDLTLDLRPSNCGITVDDLPYTDNFDSYTTSTTAKTGVAPDCWTLAYQEVAMTDEYKPMIYYNSSNAYSGSYSLILNKRCLYAMPAYSGDVSALQLSFYLKQTNVNYGLTVGVMRDLEDLSTFVPVASFNNPSTANHEYVVVDFSSYTGDGHYIAFRNTNTAISNFSCNYIDDITLELRPTGCPAITVADLPYSDNFDGYTTSTIAKTGVEPTCWTLAHQYVSMTDEYKPMIYYNASNAHSGSYSLLLNKRCIYAMPEFDGDISTLQLSMYVKQGQAKYQLQVGVMSDLSNPSSFVPVTTINNSGTGYVLRTVNFSSYTGSGHYIAFRNVLPSGVSESFSCNYIDDITLSLAASKGLEGNGNDVSDNEPLSQKWMTVFPNPTSGMITVEADGEIERIDIFDYTGRCVATFEHQSTVDLSGFAEGLYTLRCTLPDRIEVRRVVKQ